MREPHAWKVLAEVEHTRTFLEEGGRRKGTNKLLVFQFSVGTNIKAYLLSYMLEPDNLLRFISSEDIMVQFE